MIVTGIRLNRNRAGRLLLLAWPTIVTFSVLASRSLVDVWMVGRLGAEDLAALAPAQLVLTFLLSLGIGSVISVNAFVAHARGTGQDDTCGSYAWQGIWLGAGYGVAVGLLGYLGADWFTLFQHEAAVTEREITYFRVVVLSCPLQMVAFVLINFFLGIERPLYPMFVVLCSVFVHALSGFALIYGNWGFASLGVAGAGWALVISTLFQTVAMVTLLLVVPRLQRFGGRKVGLDLAKITSIVKTGGPIGIRDILDNVAWTIALIWLIGRWGTIHLASASVLLISLDFLILPCDGLGAALVTMIGNSIGRGKVALARRWFFAALGIMTLYAVAAGLLFWGFRGPLLDFLAGDPGVSALSQSLAFFVAILLLIYAWYSAYDHALCGAGDNLWPAAANLVLCIFVLGLGGLLLGFWFPQFESYGGWGLVTVYLVLVVALFRFRWRQETWGRQRLVPAEGSI
ncbi:MAG: MATE family efflux transporter [Verrucomicrobiota bacterium]